MSGKWISIILTFICIGFIVGSVISFTVPYEREENIESIYDLGIVDGLTVPFHEHFPLSSYNQIIDISVVCSDGSIDIYVMEGTEWDAFIHAENYSSYFEAKNVTGVMTIVEIDPPSYNWIDIILQTKYGGVNISINISSQCMGYDITTAINSALIAIPFCVGSYYYYPKKKMDEKESVEIGIS